jgi:hypothetical protein
MKTLISILFFSIFTLAQDKDSTITIDKELANIKQGKEYLKNEYQRLENIEQYLLLLKRDGCEIKQDSTKVKVKKP